MRPLEQMLSPMIKNNLKDVNQNEISLLDEIKKLKMEVLCEKINSSQVTMVRPEIVESWLRSFKYGLNPNDNNNGIILDQNAYDELIKEKAFLIQAADPFIQQLENMDSNYLILLTDEQGIILRVATGKKRILEQVTERFHLIPGAIWSEQSVGTCSHVMSLLLRSPIQLCGPEIYLETCSQVLGRLLGSGLQSNVLEEFDDLNQTVCSSAPIFDLNGNLAGSLTIISPYLHHQNSHSLGLTISTAWAIQNQFQLALNSALLNVTLEAADEAIITIDQNGIITKANMIAQKTFYNLYQELTGRHLDDVLGHQPVILAVMETGRSVFNTDILLEGKNQKLLLRSAQAVKDSYGKNLGCVLTFKQIERIKKNAHQLNGAEAKFTFDDIIGKSPLMLKLIEIAKKYSCLDTNVLIQGDSGTGKEVFAQSIHNESRPNGNFIAINCAAIPITLIESELFGYEGGAFTGTDRQGRPGKIELANGGTLFLDEIGDMPLEIQPVLLRVLEEKRVMRVGASRYIPVNFRLITATNKNLLERVKNKQFREDLYYRVAVLKLQIAPLKDRGPDIIRLARHFISDIAQNQQIPAPVLSDPAIFRLLEYNWPGNIRQLHSALLYSVNMASDGIIELENLPEEICPVLCDIYSGGRGQKAAEDTAYNQISNNELTIKDMEKITIMQALLQTNHNVSEAASILGMSRSTLYRKIKGYKVLEDMRINS
ncbi:MAG: sigma 54-interacting transcriptional regulator [Bacillota bacterium]|nr:sigma 54-interacting transcriptional regulator [Bacillota bacterium]